VKRNERTDPADYGAAVEQTFDELQFFKNSFEALRCHVNELAQKSIGLQNESMDNAPYTDNNEKHLLLEQSVEKIRKMVSARRLRNRYFSEYKLADPAWDIVLDLALARIDRVDVSISSLCIAANVPTTTALRWIKALVKDGTIYIRPDPADARRRFVHISDQAYLRLLGYAEKA
jgi:hypothetical protein